MREKGLRALTCLAVSVALAVPGGASEESSAAETAAIVHVLNRLGYGPRPGDVEAVRRMGIDAWVQRQLHPDRVDDTRAEARVAALATATLPIAELRKGYEVPREARREIQKRRAEMGNDASTADARRARREMVRKYAGQMKGSPRQVVDELQQAKVLRAVYSERQLHEVLVDFWMNHFNVYASKGPERFLVGAYEREVIRPRAWGRFEDLLAATAKSPAMLFYLDNWLSSDPDATSFMRRARHGENGFSSRHARTGARGLNENYAREILELHTLGVDGGFTQKDVTEVARALTGWTIAGLRAGEPRFAFNARLHDRGEKTILGRRIAGGGREEGEQVIHMLATHPQTARFVSYKLARRFVADEPPAALVDRAAQTFRRTDGDIRAVLTTIVTSPEFLAPAARGAKIKTPLEFVASAVRASGAEVTSARELARRIALMGMPLYQQQPPTGYKDTADAWVSTGGLLARMNLAADLASGNVPGVSVDPKAPAVADGGRALGAPAFQRR
jgi:uncharacterized protein (DUF1800 family)